MIFAIFTLVVAIVISAVAAYYSIVGLTAIFAAAVIPIIIMGAALEVGKITAAVWLKMNWARASITYKLYLVPAVALLMLLTSMGIFGFLSKAHTDQVLVKGNTGEQVALYDEQIKVERETIDNAKSLITQMDSTVKGILEKGESREIKLRDGRIIVRSPAELALQVRRSQAKDRAALTTTIEESQASILALQQKRAPFAAEQRNVEAKIGPIKYIAALIYGDNPDQNLLESAVRWVIIIIVVVFDPLALVLILAAQQSIRWHREDRAPPPIPPTTPTDPTPEPPKPEPEEEKTEAPEFAPVMKPVVVSINDEPNLTPPEPNIKHEYLKQPFTTFSNLKPMVAPQNANSEPDLEKANRELQDIASQAEPQEPFVMPMPGTLGGVTVVFPEEKTEENNNELVQENSTPEDTREETPDAPIDTPIEGTGDGDRTESTEVKRVPIDIDLTPEEVLEDLRVLEDWAKKQEIETRAIELPLKRIGDADYWEYRGKKMSGEVLRNDFPEVAKMLEADNEEPNAAHSDFGSRFPESANRGDLFLRIDYMPNRLYKYNGIKWIEVDKNATDTMAFDERYIEYVIEKLKSGEMDVDDLSASEQVLVEQKLKVQDGKI